MSSNILSDKETCLSVDRLEKSFNEESQKSSGKCSNYHTKKMTLISILDIQIFVAINLHP